MKGGLLAGLYALRASCARSGHLPFGRIVFVANPDEEIGSPVSTPVIGASGATRDVALVMEGARANGDIVSSRKGIADFELRITGRAAHAGVEPEKGRSAVLEAAHKVVALHALNGRWPGVTVNAGVVRGGTARTSWRPRPSSRSTSARSSGHARGGRGGHPRHRGVDNGARHDLRCRAHGPLLADGEAGAVRPAGGHAVRIAAGSASRCVTRPRAAHRMPTPSPGWACPPSTGWGPIGGNDHSPGGVPGGRLHRAPDGAAGRAHPGGGS